MTVAEAINSHDMDSIIDSMTAYVCNKLKDISIKELEGKEPFDLVQEVIFKVVEGNRDWSKANCSFKEFLFGCLKSHLNNFFKKIKYKFEPELPTEIATNQNNVVERKASAIEFLKDAGADRLELDVFECWADGINKPSQIARELETDVGTINNATKRLMRKIPGLRTFQKTII